MIVPRKPSGFPEWIPNIEILQQRYKDIIRKNYELFGYTPIETPSVELKETVASKGGDDKQIYALSRLNALEGEDSSTDMALHFDLTVPFARYVSEHLGSGVIKFPFKRYQIQKVWRGERTQHGRAREFYQCDIDVIGNENLSLYYDAEVLAVASKTYIELHIGDFKILINHRDIIDGILNVFNIPNDKILHVMHIIDDVDKISKEKFIQNLQDLELSDMQISNISDYINMSIDENNIEDLYKWGNNATLTNGIEELKNLFKNLDLLKVDKNTYKISNKIVRGLDYYTGIVFETHLIGDERYGSIGSGGRYENLADNFSKKHMPGVGFSIGLTRLIDLLQITKRISYSTDKLTITDILITNTGYQEISHSIANILRQNNIHTEIYPESLHLKKQLEYANAKHIDYLILVDETTTLDNVILKTMSDSKQQTDNIYNIISIIQNA